MSTTATTVAIVSANNAAIAAANAERARQFTAFCQGYMPEFKAATATQEQARTYSQCVQHMYPKPDEELVGTDLLIVKAVVALVILGAVAGSWFGWNEDGVLGAIIGAFLGATGTLAVLLGLYGIAYGIWFLFS